MSSKPTPNVASAREDSNAFINDYLADWDDDDLFRSPSPEPSKKAKANDSKNDSDGKKRKTDALGIDEQIDVTKKARAPRVKLDEGKLLSEKGIPKLRKMTPRLKLKGKGHEFSDAARLLSFYQEWLDDLFPKATFLDALDMVEKTGHKTIMRNERLKWIDEGRPRTNTDEGDGNQERQPSVPKEPSRIAPIFEKAAQARAATPSRDDSFDDQDIYNATPRAKPSSRPEDDIPDDDDLDALMAEADAAAAPNAPSFGSIFSGGAPKKPAQSAFEPEDDDLEALMAEAEAQSSPPKLTQSAASGSIFGGGAPKKTAQSGFEADDDLEALMAEAEAESAASKPTPPSGSGRISGNGTSKPKSSLTAANDDDDLEALMAEAEAQPASTKSSGTSQSAKGDQGTDMDEGAMAEMDGLW